MRASFVIRVALGLVAYMALDARAGAYLGAESCKACHAAAYDAWQKSPHARAAERLTPDQAKQALCLQCHSPNAAASSGLTTGVSCETCHGGGAFYSPRYVMRDPELARAVGLVDADQKTCSVCHNDGSPSMRKFDLAEKMQLLDHWTPERQKRGGKKAKDAVGLRACPADFLSRALAANP